MALLRFAVLLEVVALIFVELFYFVVSPVSSRLDFYSIFLAPP